MVRKQVKWLKLLELYFLQGNVKVYIFCNVQVCKLQSLKMFKKFKGTTKSTRVSFKFFPSPKNSKTRQSHSQSVSGGGEAGGGEAGGGEAEATEVSAGGGGGAAAGGPTGTKSGSCSRPSQHSLLHT